MKRRGRIVAAVFAATVVALALVAAFVQPKVRHVVTPSGRAYDLIEDLVSTDGQY